MENCLINLTNEFETLATRKTGKSAREKLVEQLALNSNITLDFDGHSISPSFADEFIGILAKDMGFSSFKQRIKLVNVSNSSKTIIMHVLNKRLKQVHAA